MLIAWPSAGKNLARSQKNHGPGSNDDQAKNGNGVCLAVCFIKIGIAGFGICVAHFSHITLI